MGGVDQALLTAGLLVLVVCSWATPVPAPDAEARAPAPLIASAPEEAAVEPALEPPPDTTADMIEEAAPKPAPLEPAPEPASPALSRPSLETAPAPAPPEPPAPPAPLPEPVRVVVPRIGVANPLVPVGLHPDHTLVVPDEPAVAGWYTGAPRPGETGPSIIAGHNAWGGVQGVFFRLHQLVPGDVVEVHHDDGSVVRFAVQRVEQHPKAAFPSERVYGDTSRQEVRVITCGGVFDHAQGSHLDNIIVFGVRIS